MVLMTARRLPPPWSVEEYNDACFLVRDHNGQQLAYVYFEDEPRESAAKLLRRRPSVISLFDTPILFESPAVMVATFPIPPRARRTLECC
jgi:hypothetical protein